MTDSQEPVADVGDRERRRERREERQEERGKVRKRRGVVFTILSLMLFVTLGACSGILSWAGCKPGVFRDINEGDQMDDNQSQPQPLGGLGGMPPHTGKPTTNVTRSPTTNRIVSSESTGRGFHIVWRSEQNPNGAAIEDVLDVVLSRMQSLQNSPEGGDQLARVIFQADKTMQELRSTGFSESQAYGSQQSTGPGFQLPPSAGDAPGSSNPS